MSEKIDQYMAGFVGGLNGVLKNEKSLNLYVSQISQVDDLSISVKDHLLSNMWCESELPSMQKISRLDMEHYLRLIFDSVLLGIDTRNLAGLFARVIDDEYGKYDLFGEFIKDNDGDMFIFVIEYPLERKVIAISWSII